MGISNQASGFRPGVCTSTTRPSAPYKGQVIFETDTDRLYVWNGSAWVIPNSPAQNPGGLELVKTDTITSGNSKEITGCFSSTYNNYKIVVDNLKADSVQTVQMLLGTTTSSVYFWSGHYVPFGQGIVTASAMNSTVIDTGGVSSSDVICTGTIEFQNPNNATATGFQCLMVDPRTSGSTNARYYSGFVNNTTQYTSFTLKLTGGAFTSCNISVYGYRK